MTVLLVYTVYCRYVLYYFFFLFCFYLCGADLYGPHDPKGRKRCTVLKIVVLKWAYVDMFKKIFIYFGTRLIHELCLVRCSRLSMP